MIKLTKEQLKRKMRLTPEEQEELDRIIEAREIEELRQSLSRVRG